MWEAHAFILLKKNSSFLPPLGSDVLTRKVTLYNLLCYSFLIIYFFLTRPLKSKITRRQTPYQIKREGIDYFLLPACKRRRHQSHLYSASHKCFQLCESGYMHGQVHSPLALSFPPDKPLACGSEKSDPNLPLNVSSCCLFQLYCLH